MLVVAAFELDFVAKLGFALFTGHLGIGSRDLFFFWSLLNRKLGHQVDGSRL